MRAPPPHHRAAEACDHAVVPRRALPIEEVLLANAIVGEARGGLTWA